MPWVHHARIIPKSFYYRYIRPWLKPSICEKLSLSTFLSCPYLFNHLSVFGMFNPPAPLPLPHSALSLMKNLAKLLLSNQPLPRKSESLSRKGWIVFFLGCFLFNSNRNTLQNRVNQKVNSFRRMVHHYERCF